MKNVERKSKFSVIWLSCVVILVVIILYAINISLKKTSAHFGGVTGELTAYKVTYLSNYMDMTLENEIYVDQKKNIYQILDNMFDVPFGYEFTGWNTKNDGTGDGYVVSDVITLKSSLVLYAQWILVSGDTNKLSYGDVNQNGQIDNEDYALIENHVLGINILTDQALLNADVNADGCVDLVDVDIVKQVYLGTIGYVGYLPNSPILIYDIYEGSIDIDSGNIIDGNSNNESSSSSNNVSSGNGNGSMGTGNNTNGGDTGGSSLNNGAINNNLNDSGNEEYNDSLSEQLIYQFKFMNGDLEYASTQCDVLEDGTCELILPSNNPVKNGYVFNGWSEVQGCSNGSGKIAPMVVSNGGTYYACFIVNSSEDEENNTSYVWIIVILICFIALRLIFHLIHKFKEKEKNSY